MGLMLFFIFSLLSGAAVFLSGSKILTRAVTLLYGLSLIGFAFYAWLNIDTTELVYFTFNSTGVLFLSVLAVLAIPTMYHGFIYTSDDNTRKSNVYHAALIALMTFMAGAYLANGMTVLWIFVEATTLAVAALIYHDKIGRAHV